MRGILEVGPFVDGALLWVWGLNHAWGSRDRTPLLLPEPVLWPLLAKRPSLSPDFCPVLGVGWPLSFILLVVLAVCCLVFPT